MSLDFLAPSADGPVARSPMERSAAEEGARFELRDGWNVAVEYRSPPVSDVAGWADMSHITKLEVQGAGETIDAAAGFPLPFGTAMRQDGAWWCRLTATRALVVGAHPSPSIRERLTAADGVKVVDVTTNFAAITLLGPLAREVFARFSAIDLRPQVTPPGALRPGSIARQPGILICEVPDRYLLLFGWATGEYVWSVVADAGYHLCGRPIGLDALAKLPGPAPAEETARA